MQDSSGKNKFIVGLTGGIGSGKSTVSELFANLGINVIDADIISRSLVKKGSPCYQKIIEHFGEAILDGNGDLDRAQLRTTIFDNDQAKSWLENLLHPLIRQNIYQQIEESESAYIVLVVPLLLESDAYNFVNSILVVDVPESVQIERIMKRDKNDEASIKKIINSQIGREDRLQQADDVIDNTVARDALILQVNQLHEKYLNHLNGQQK